MFKSEREYYAEKTRVATALEDVWAWAEYYDAVLKNCAISSALLPLRSYAESKKEFLCVSISHTGQMDVPVHRRFKVESVGREKVEDYKFMVDLGPETYAKTERMGKIEFENDFYGVLSYVVLTMFNDTKGDLVTVYSFPKQFSIDKRTARANMLQLDWWNLLRRYVSDGRKIKFCCGQLAKELNICCCGGWAHDEEKREDLKRDWGM